MAAQRIFRAAELILTGSWPDVFPIRSNDRRRGRPRKRFPTAEIRRRRLALAEIARARGR